jgi:NAD-dependent dihydropyrimidine dehydrogenase PreA subunit
MQYYCSEFKTESLLRLGVDVFIPNPEKGNPLIIVNHDECWYCGCCVDCRQLGAISFNWPLQQRGSWKDKSSGKIMRDTV